ncbi:hypothetical protein [Hymenobacter properus]|uniref:Uncharacterized protein n=1 Tax=Hymenobacter properus TaxID=2791026 RepID=A0A931FJ41_9BACT|nr:hypothetical protein [Hymenobacter properus]MBF9140100.1 hypothetical protein [Hymenobacter properus]MBR7718907.1 hypothetical protein [Microvirga sp. SRT04]
MKKLFLFLFVGFGLNACNQQPPQPLAADQVNVLVGNAGYVAATGQAPTAATNDDARVQAHLAYAERQLRQRPTAGLSPELTQRRAHLLDLLHRYWVAGVFPRNYDHPEGRRPCFIDRDGRLCAVGYLVAETAGRPAAERINDAHQYDLIADMRTPVLADWVKTSGLTRAECALIQPTYGPPPPTEADVKSYAVGSALWSGVNVMLGAANASQFNRPTGGKGAAYAGILSGTGQLLTGALRLPNDEQGINWSRVTTYGTERNISYLNIGLGTATLALSAWNLISHRNAAQQKTTVGVVNFPGPAGGSGLSLTRRF